MREVGIWRVSDDRPTRLKSSQIGLEKQLEDWIERDPSLVEERMQIVGRQIKVHRGRLDLLGIDMQGRWTVIELKPSDLYHDALAQALYYAAGIAEMSPENLEQKVDEYLTKKHPDGSVTARLLLEKAGTLESLDTVPRDVQIVLVGTGRSADFERVIGFLERSVGTPAKTITFQVFEPRPGTTILLRELRSWEDGSSIIVRPPPPPDEVLERVRNHADATGTRELLEEFLKFGEDLGLHRRPWGRSVMLAPQQNKRLCVTTLWVDSFKDGTVRFWIDPERLVEYLSMSEEGVNQALGENLERVTHDQARLAMNRIRSLYNEQSDCERWGR